MAKCASYNGNSRKSWLDGSLDHMPPLPIYFPYAPSRKLIFPLFSLFLSNKYSYLKPETLSVEFYWTK